MTDLSPFSEMGATTNAWVAQHDLARDLERLNRELLTLKACDRAIVRAVDEEELLREICRICVEIGGYRMAWIGYAQDDPERHVAIVADAGSQDDYLATADIRWSDTELGQGPTGTAIRTGAPVVARDIGDDTTLAPWRDNALRLGYHSSIALPLLRHGGHAFGALNLYSESRDHFDIAEVDLLAELADDVAFAVDALRDRLEAERYRVLANDTQDIVLFVDAMTGRVLGANRAAVQAYGHPQERLLTMNIRELRAPQCRDKVGDQMQLAMEHGLLMETEHVRADGTVFPVEVSSRRVDFDNGEVLFSIIRDITVRKELERRLEEQAMTDPLTALANRRRFFELARREIARSRRTGEPYAVALMDIDRLKRINDTHGHASGDAVLIAFAAAASEAVREIDVLARYGGDEFGLFLPNADAETAEAVLARVRERLRERGSIAEVPAELVSSSFGLAAATPRDALEASLERADAALYRAKAAGRDRIERA